MLYSWFAARYSGLGQRVYTFDVSRQKDSQIWVEGKSYLRNLRIVYLKVFLAHLLGFIQLLDGYRPQTVISVRLTASSAAGKLAQSWIQYLIDAWAGLASSSHETSSAGPSLSAVRGCRVSSTVAVVYGNQQEKNPIIVQVSLPILRWQLSGLCWLILLAASRVVNGKREERSHMALLSIRFRDLNFFFFQSRSATSFYGKVPCQQNLKYNAATVVACGV